MLAASANASAKAEPEPSLARERIRARVRTRPLLSRVGSSGDASARSDALSFKNNIMYIMYIYI